MSLWLVRAGSSGEHEARFLRDGRIYVTWEGFDRDLTSLASREVLIGVLEGVYPDRKPKAVANWASQIWPFVGRMQTGDWVVLPSKTKAVLHFGEITGPYQFNAAGPDPYFHSRTVKWFAQDIPRSRFDQDLLYSFGAFMTICRIERNDAERRVRQMATNDWKPAAFPSLPLGGDEDTPEASGAPDIERFSKDEIARFITTRFAGHGLARLVEAVLKAKGFFTYRSPPGADKGVDLLASAGALGFDRPKICVQVKSGDTPVDRPTLDQLIGAMQNFGADAGLLVSWSGFRSSVDREVPAQFFRVRLWDQDSLIEELLASYDKLDDELKAELPLKKVWAIAYTDE
jgi:restriction system protein